MSIVNRTAGRSKHQAVHDRLLSDIQSGRLIPGDSLPTEMALVEQFRFSRQTIRQALADLENAGWIERVQGRGTFVANRTNQTTRTALDIFAYIAPQLQTDVYPWMLSGFQKTSAEQGYQTLVGHSGDDLGRQADALMQMMDQKVGGVALVPTTQPLTPLHQVRLLRTLNVPVVFCHRAVAGLSAPAALIDGRVIGRLAGETLLDHGHRRVAFLYHHRYSMTENYGQGLRDAWIARQLDPAGVIDIAYERHAAFQPGRDALAVQAELDALMQRPEPPTAVFCGNPPLAELVYLHGLAKGWRIPGDLSIICVGSLSRDQGLVQRLTTVAVDEIALGSCAARMLHEMRTGRRALDSDETVYFSPTLLPGETVGPPAKDRRRTGR